MQLSPLAQSYEHDKAMRLSLRHSVLVEVTCMQWKAFYSALCLGFSGILWSTRK